MLFRTLLLFLILFPQSYIFAQADIFEELDAAFDARVQQMDRDFSEYTRQMDEDFIKYLRRHWEPFQVVETDETKFSDKSNFVNISYSAPIAYPSYKALTNAVYATEKVAFFGKTISLKIDTGTKFSLRSVSEEHVSQVWDKLSKSGFSTIVERCDYLRSNLKINDWGVYLFVSQLSDQIFDANQQNEKKVFVAFILTHAGYDVKLGRLGSMHDINCRLLVLLPFNANVKRKKTTCIDKKRYCIDPLAVNADIGEKQKIEDYDKTMYSYRKNLKLAKSDLDLSVWNTPLLGSVVLGKPIRSNTEQLRNVEIAWRDGLADYYDTYPNTILSVYLNAPLSYEVKQSLRKFFPPVFDRMVKKEAVELLLHWFHHGFPYRLDEVERPLFSEQTVRNDYSDCEDRAVFFARLVKDFLGLDVVLIVYKETRDAVGHVAVGVCFGEKVGGLSENHNGKNYTICDPSIRKCAVGYVKDEYKGKPCEIIEMIR